MIVKLGDILFWAAYLVAMITSLSLVLGVRASARVARVTVAGLVVCGLAVAAPRLPAESIGKTLLCSMIGVMYLVLFSVLARGRR